MKEFRMTSLAVLSVLTLAGLSACQDKETTSDHRFQPPPPATEWTNPSPQSPVLYCDDLQISTYNRVINNASDFSWEGEGSYLMNLLSSCGQLHDLLRNNQQCLATHIATGQIITISFLDVKDICDTANHYNRTYDYGKNPRTGAKARQRQSDFDLKRIQQMEVQPIGTEKGGRPVEPPKRDGDSHRPSPPKRTGPSGN